MRGYLRRVRALLAVAACLCQANCSSKNPDEPPQPGNIVPTSNPLPESLREIDFDLQPGLGVNFDFPESKNDRGRFTKTPSFGIHKIVNADPVSGKVVGVRLTFSELGFSNSTLVRVDGQAHVVGDVDTGTYVKLPEDLYWEKDNRAIPTELRGRKKGMRANWRFTGIGIDLIQTVELVAGEPLESAPGEFKRRIDTCLVHYRLANNDSKEHKVGMRFLLDTMIGENDEPYFVVPGFKSLVDTCQDFPGKDGKPIPAYMQAIENKRLQDPGVVAHLNLRLTDNVKRLTSNVTLKDKLESISRVSLTRWYKSVVQKGKIISSVYKKLYDIPMPWELEPPDRNEGFNRDSAVVMYWEERDMKPGEVRDMAFTYGLGDIQTKTGLSLTVRGNFNAGGELTVVALVGDPKPGETLTLVLPKDKFKVVRGPEKQEVPPAEAGKPSAVTWTISSISEGLFDLEVISSASNKIKKQKIRVRSSSLF